MSRFNTDLEEHDCAYMPIEIRDGTRVICKVYQDDAPLHDYNREQTAYAKRIVACLNACDGLSTEALERLGTLDRARVSFNVQRDKLLAQLIRCRDMVGHSDSIAYIAEIDKTIAEVQR